MKGRKMQFEHVEDKFNAA